MSALSKLVSLIFLTAMIGFVKNVEATPPNGWIISAAYSDAAAEKKANSFKDLLALRKKAEIRKYSTNKALPLGQIRTYLEAVGIAPNLEERWVLAQFLYLNGWDLFGNDGFETKFTGRGHENDVLSTWVRKNHDLFVDGDITKKDLEKAK